MSRRNRILIGSAALSLMMTACQPGLWAQATGGTISGLVRDTSQAVITGATITLANTETGIVKTRQTDGAGRYRIGELQPGTYQVTVSMVGFSTETRKDIKLLVGQELTLGFELPVGAMETQVDVTAEVPLVETTTAAVASVVTQEQLRELPLNGRSFTDLVTLQVAAVTPSNAANSLGYGSGPQLSVAGGRADSNSYSIDGTDMGATANGTPGSAASLQLGVDTIREYQVITTNAKAESGRNSGAQINAVTRSGTNSMHGSLFEFFRNSALDSRKFTDPSQIPPFRQNQFGGTVGGPILHDKTFYFIAYEGLRRRLAQTQVYNVIPLDQRDGTGILTGSQQLDPRVKPFINLWPAPNLPEIIGSGNQRVGQYSEAPSQPLGENYGSARVDHTFSAKDSMFGRFTIDRALQNDVLALQQRDTFYTQNMYITLQEDHVLSPAMVNTFRVGYNRSTLSQKPDAPLGSEGLTYLPGTNHPLGSIGVTNFSTVGDSGAFYYQVQNAFQYSDDLTYTRGAHTMKFGTAIERFQWNTDRPMDGNGSMSFPNLASFYTLTQVGTSAISSNLLLPESSTYRHIRTTMFGFYGQDDYAVKPNLTLNYGLRWEFTTGLHELDDHISYLRKGWVDSGPNDFVLGEFFTNHKTIFQPRLGFNWDIKGTQKNVLSGGFGVFHNQILHNAVVSFRAQLPFYFRANAANVSATAKADFPNLRPMIANTGITFTDTRHFDHDNFKTPTVYRYNLTYQRQMAWRMSLRTAFIGSFSRHLARRQALNASPWPTVNTDGSLQFRPKTSATECCFINPNISALDWMSSDVNATYNALAVTLQKTFSQGMTFQASYTYSKSIDDQSSSESNYSGNQVTGQYSPDRTLDRARSSFNVPQVFVFNGLYELPVGPGKPFLNSTGVVPYILGGWQVSGVVTIQQGTPFTVTSGVSSSTSSFNANRPNMKPNIDVNSLTQSSNKNCIDTNSTLTPRPSIPCGGRNAFFDATAFTAPPAGTIGNASRSLLLGPAFANMNITLSKSFPLPMGEATRLQFRGEFFNVLNQTKLALPSAAVFNATGAISPTVGRITNIVGTMRQIQFALKLTF